MRIIISPNPYNNIIVLHKNVWKLKLAIEFRDSVCFNMLKTLFSIQEVMNDKTYFILSTN